MDCSVLLIHPSDETTKPRQLKIFFVDFVLFVV
jgi:hypothetical protein